ncbi:MAG: glycosyltransferase family 1 protein [Verrucomicrobia bacterium]|nr:glycosyltransferase family 1 protein [Verrucomicrobiota bacterium]
MLFPVDQTNEVMSEIDRYQKEALKALLLENILCTQEWYLAADAAAHFMRRKKSCELLGNLPSPLIHQVATLILSTQEQQEKPALKAYHYWIACSQALSSSKLMSQLFAHLEVIQKQCRKTFPEALPFLQEAEHYFRKIELSEKENVLSEQQLLSHHWSALIYDAFFFTTSKNIAPLAQEILLARRRAINATEAHHHPRSHTWSLIAFAKENIFEKKSALKIDRLEKKLLEANPNEAWQQALRWLLVACQAKQKENVQAVKAAIFISKKWEYASALGIKKKTSPQFSFFSKLLLHCWSLLARNAENRYHFLIKVTLLHEVTFCLPSPCLPNQTQQEQQARGLILPELEYSVFYIWIYQTWHYLTQAGIPCKLSHQLSNEGMIITMGGALPPLFGKKFFLKNLFLVDAVADATFHLIQNKKKAQQIKNALYIPHWPQPHLIPRHPERKNRFENIGFFGHDKNLAPELQTHRWQQRLKKELGLDFKIKRIEEWHDYSDVDCVIAIRNFSKEPHLDKPGTKLYNAWLAGVPFIGGNDSAYRADGHPGKDYLVATSLEKTFQHLRRLKEDEAFRMKLVAAGKKSAVPFTKEATLERWKKVVTEIIPDLAMKQYQKKIATKERKEFEKKYSIMIPEA